jgi:hypothetical protein
MASKMAISFSKPSSQRPSMITADATSSLVNYKLKILSSLAAKACSWSAISSRNDHSHEERRFSNSETSTPVEDLRKRDKKAVIKVL